MAVITELDKLKAESMEDLIGPGTAKEMGFNGAYDAASRFDKTMALWNPPRRSADGDILPEKATMDARTKDAMRNDGYVQAGQALHRDNIVGGMFMLNAKPNYKALGLDEEWAEAFQEEVEAKFTLAVESTSCWLDASRTNTLTSLVRLAVSVFAATGEVFAAIEWMRGDKLRPFQTAVQMVDVDRLTTPYDKQNDGYVRGGVKLDLHGAPLGYYVLKAHPQDWDRTNKTLEWKYVKAYKPWGRPQVIHIKEQTRPEQTRGVSEIVAGLKELHITKKFRDITLQNAVVNAMFAASIESELPSEAVFSQLGSNNAGASAGKYAESFLSAVAEYTGSANNMMLDGVKIPHLFPGTKLNLHPAGTPGGVGQDFETSLLRYISAILGVSYEQLSKDFTKTNYSSARAGMVETWKFMQSRKRMVADRFANVIYRCWLEEQINKGLLDCMKNRTVPNFYEGVNAEAYCGAEWIGASRGQIDELKETQAAILRMKNGLSTQEDELAKLGKDYRVVNTQIARETKMRENLGIEFFESNAMNAATGQPQEANSGEESTGEANEK